MSAQYNKSFETPLLSQKTDINEISDNRVRYISMGIVSVTEPLKIAPQGKKSFFNCIVLTEVKF